MCPSCCFFKTYWERAARLHWCPCVIELKWAWFMLGPTEFPSGPCCCRSSSSFIQPDSIALWPSPRSALRLFHKEAQNEFKQAVAEDAVTWSASPIGGGFTQSSSWVAASSTSPFHLSSRPFWMIGETSSKSQRPALPPALVHVTWDEDKHTSAADQSCFSSSLMHNVCEQLAPQRSTSQGSPRKRDQINTNPHTQSKNGRKWLLSSHTMSQNR